MPCLGSKLSATSSLSFTSCIHMAVSAALCVFCASVTRHHHPCYHTQRTADIVLHVLLDVVQQLKVVLSAFPQRLKLCIVRAFGFANLLQHLRCGESTCKRHTHASTRHVPVHIHAPLMQAGARGEQKRRRLRVRELVASARPATQKRPSPRHRRASHPGRLGHTSGEANAPHLFTRAEDLLLGL